MSAAANDPQVPNAAPPRDAAVPPSAVPAVTPSAVASSATSAVAAPAAVLAEARACLDRGWALVALREGTKIPMATDWPRRRLRAGDLWRTFGVPLRLAHVPADRDGQAGGIAAVRATPNLGVILGAASGGLVDVDCDCPEASIAAGLLLPETGRVSGRPSHPASHFWYLVAGGAPQTTKFRAPQSTPASVPTGGTPTAVDEPVAAPETEREHTSMLVELRADGCQTMIPPSRHPCGELLRWERDGAPARVDAAELAAGVAQVGAAALLARSWPMRGTRDEAALALTGLLVRAGWTAPATDRFVRAVAQAAGDEEWQHRAKAQATVRALAAGNAVLGAPGLAQRLRGEGAAVVSCVSLWLGLSAGWGRGGRGHTAYGEDGGPGDGAAQEAAPSQPRTASLFPLNEDAQHEDAHKGPVPKMSIFDTFGIFGANGPWVGMPENGSVGQLLRDIPVGPVAPLWGGRLYYGMLALCDGDPGGGKTLLALDLAARLTTGRPMPDGSPGSPACGVVYFTAEDDPARTLRPRLETAGGDPSRMLVVTTLQVPGPLGELVERVPTLRDLSVIASAIAQVNARLVIFDPFMAYLDASTSAIRDQEVRAVLTPLTHLAERTGAAILFIRHLNKNAGTRAIYRGSGSVGIIGAMRSALLVGRDPGDEQRQIIASTKNNLGPTPASLAFRIVGGIGKLPVIQWEGESPLTAEMLAAGSAGGGAPRVRDQAEDFLRALLAKGPQPQQVIEDQAQEAGLSWTAVRRAKQRLLIRSRKQGFGEQARWVWELVAPDQPAAPNTNTPPDGSTAEDP